MHALHAEFQVKDVGEPHFLLGMRTERPSQSEVVVS